MSPQTIQLFMVAAKMIAELIKEAPALRKAIVELFSKEEPTEGDWTALEARCRGKTYEDFVPHTQLKKEP